MNFWDEHTQEYFPWLENLIKENLKEARKVNDAAINDDKVNPLNIPQEPQSEWLNGLHKEISKQNENVRRILSIFVFCLVHLV